MKPIILMGIKHCGKSTQARLVSTKLGCQAFDTDDMVTEMTGKTPRQIYSTEGKEAFMKAEAEACRKLEREFSEPGKMAVIATGGGICGNSEAVDILRKLGTLVFLKVDEATASHRVMREITVADDGTLGNMPAYIANKNPSTIDDCRKIFHGFYEERVELYRTLSDITVDVTNSSKQENADQIIEATAGMKKQD